MSNSFNGKKLTFQVVLINILFPLFFVQLSQSLLQIYNPALQGGMVFRLTVSVKPVILMLFLIAAVAALLIIGRILKPLRSFFKQGEQYEAARKATLSIPWVLMSVHSLLWILSNFAFYMAYHWVTPGGVPFFWSLSLSVLSGLLGALFSSIVMNIIFVPVKGFLKMTERNPGEEDLFSLNKNLIITVVVVLSAVLFTTYAGRYYASTGEPNGISYIGTVILLSFIFLTAGIVLILLSRQEDRAQIRIMTEKLKELNAAGGDLTGKLYLLNFDKTGDLVEEINHLMEKLHSAFSEVAEAAGEMQMISDEIDRSIDAVRETSSAILASSRDVDASLADQETVVATTGEKLGEMLQGVGRISDLVEVHRSSVDSTSSTIEEMTANIVSVSDHSQAASRISEELNESIVQGSQAVKSSISCIEGILETSEQMNGLVHLIGKLAAQTNMLAMNAAIEAAHAGDKGLGFAVVADEVRKLAGNSAENTSYIAGNIHTLNEKVDQGVRTSREAGTILDSVLKMIEESAMLSSEIAAAMIEQKSGTDDLIRVVSDVVTSSSGIQVETNRQVSENSLIKENIENFMGQCRRIRELTNTQLTSYSTVYESLSDLKGLSEEGKKLGSSLQSVISGFTL